MLYRIVAVLALCSALTVSSCKCCRTCGDSGSDKETSSSEVQPESDTAPASPADYRHERTRLAMRGLTYDTGRVVVDEDLAATIAERGDDEAADAEFQRGEDLLAHNYRTDALAAYTRAVLIMPDEAYLYVGLAEALIFKGKDSQAEAALRTAIDLGPDQADWHWRLADTLQRQGRLDEARLEFEQTLQRDPSHAAAHGRLAVLAYYAQDDDAAWNHIAAAEDAGYEIPPQLKTLLEGEMPAAKVTTTAAPVVGEQVRIDVAGGTYAANETTIASTDVNPLEVVAAWNDWRASGGSEVVRMGVGVSIDGGENWTDYVVRPPAPYQTGVEGDPMTCYDNRTGTMWVGAIAFGSNGGLYVARHIPGTTTFEPSVMARADGSADKGWMAAGPAPGDPDQTRVYMAYNHGSIYSTDMGDTWSDPVNLGGGLGFLPRVGPQGQVYVAYWDVSDGVKLKRSLNGGASFTTHTIATRLDVWGTQSGSRFPGTFRAPSLNYIAVDPNDGTLYCVYFDTTMMIGSDYNVDLYFTKSTDQGTTWTTPRVINGDNFPPGDQFFCWLEVDQDGAIHMVFFDTRQTPLPDDSTHGMFDAYYSTSNDGGDTWHEYRLTPSMFDSDDDGLDRPTQFIGDYSGLAVGGNRVYPCYLSTQNGDSDTFTNVIVTAGPGMPGDMDCDGDVDFDDIDPFVLALGGQAVYEDAYPDCIWLNADANGDDSVDFDDIDAFVALIGG